MSLRYVAVGWNAHKRIYDAVLGIGVVGCLGAFVAITLVTHPGATAETAVIRGLGLTAFLLLNVILSIGPLARLDRRFLPLLYNRRHLGVTLGILGLAHATFTVFQYHALGNVDPLVSLLTSNTDVNSIAAFPFEWLGVVALAILLLMAATSHDFWLSVLTPPAWKRLHMMVYAAYVAVVLHVLLGFLQDERHPFYLAVVLLSCLTIGGLHILAAGRERPKDRLPPTSPDWVDVGAADRIAEGRAIIGVVAGERVAVFRHQGRLSAVSNVCRHQNGPLGEGRIIDGCITCPWHGYQYRPDSGSSPPPFADSVPTFNLRVAGGRVLIDPVPNPPGTPVEPVSADPTVVEDRASFYVGYLEPAPVDVARFSRRAVAAILGFALVVMIAAARLQRGFAPVAFDYGKPSTVEGVIRARPYPVLEVPRPGTAQVSRYLLAAAGKHGAQSSVATLDGRRVQARGLLAYRGNLTLLELAETTLLDAPGGPAGTPRDLGTFALVGEIVDSKCYSGVMNPGSGKTHRGCAARCLSGGLTPLLAVRDTTVGAGGTVEMVVLTRDGEPFQQAHRWAGRPIAVRGRVSRLDDLWLIRVEGVEPAR
jgi:nitrite reductase/ring-hydroxylating ferredoxin subunit/DMSO/TMAO reductase YedYZ heme-binding membrane subunit